MLHLSLQLYPAQTLLQTPVATTCHRLPVLRRLRSLRRPSVSNSSLPRSLWIRLLLTQLADPYLRQGVAGPPPLDEGRP